MSLVFKWKSKEYKSHGGNGSAYKYLPYDILKDYLLNNPDMPIDKIKNIFNREEFEIPTIRDQSEYNTHMENRSDENIESAKNRLFEPIEFQNDKLYITTQWSSIDTNNSVPLFIEIARTLGYKIDIINDHDNEESSVKIKNNVHKSSDNAFYGNGVFENLLQEILEAQKIDPNITSYIQPYRTTIFKSLKAQEPSESNPITFYITNTDDINTIIYTADIIQLEDKRELFEFNQNRVEELNKHLDIYQKSTGGLYRYSDTVKQSECVNLISIKNLKRVSIPFPCTMLIKDSDGEPYKRRSQPGGWAVVHKVKKIDNPISKEEYEEEYDKQLATSKYLVRGREERLEKANKRPEEIQVISRAFKRNADVVTAVLDRANGFCEKCECKAPFIRAKDNTPYLEVHHVIQLANGGEDSVENAIAVCPNCHRELHFGV